MLGFKNHFLFKSNYTCQESNKMQKNFPKRSTQFTRTDLQFCKKFPAIKIMYDHPLNDDTDFENV